MKGPIAWFARNHVAANLLMATMLVGGLLSLPNIQQKTFPDIQIDVISISVAYLGAAPEEVEQGVCIRIEEKISGITGIEKITSSAAEGACGVSAELIEGYPTDRALAEIKNAVDSISTFPVETEKPIVSHVEIERTVLQIAINAETTERSLKVYGERVRDSILALPGITRTDLLDTRDYEVAIEVPEENLRRYGLTFDEIVAAVRRGSLDRPGGSIKTTGGEILLRTKGQAYVGSDFERIVLRAGSDGTRLLLSDVATIVDGFSENDSYATFDGQPAASIRVFRVGEQRVLDLVSLVKEHLTFLGDRLPEGINLTIWKDSANTLRDRLNILLKNGISGFILVFVALSLFLRLKLAIWVSLGVPLSILGALFMFPVTDISIDVISLFAFIMVLGLLVDDAVVVGENVHRHQENAEDPLEAAIKGTQEVAVPVIFGVLTTIAAFLPLIFAPGIFGQIFGVIGLSAILCLVFSVIESQLVLPAHLGHMRPASTPADPLLNQQSFSARWNAFQQCTSMSLQNFAQNRYRPLLGRALNARYNMLAAGVAILAFTIATVVFGLGSQQINFSFFPPVESDFVTAKIEMPQGTPIEDTAAAAKILENSANETKRVMDEEGLSVDGESLIKHMLVSIGQAPSNRGGGSASHTAEVSIEIQSGDVRPISAAQIKRMWRDATPPIPDIVELSFSAEFFSAGAPIDIQLRSPDVDALRAAADRLKARIAEFAGVSDIADSFREGKKEIKLDILPAAQALGITLDDLSRQVRQAFFGEEAQRIQRGRDDVRVMIRYPQEARRSLADLEDLRIRTPDGGEVPFNVVARAEIGRGYATIKRADRQRVINVIADADAEQTAPNDIIRDLEKNFMPILTADYPTLTYSLEGEQAEQAKSFRGLAVNYGMALLAIYALLAIPLRSYVQPLIIMAVIPFGLVGAIIGHWCMYFGREIFTKDLTFNFSMMSIMGFVALTGVVVNSSLVLVHYINERRNDGWSIEDAVRAAGVARFRPIALTSITTFLGLFPILFEGSVSAQFLIPMATSLAFGVIFSTMISLFLVPCGYIVLEDIRARLSGKMRRAAPESPALQDPAR